MNDVMRSLNRNVLPREQFDVSCRCPHCNAVGAHAVTNQRRRAVPGLELLYMFDLLWNFHVHPLVSEITRPENRP